MCQFSGYPISLLTLKKTFLPFQARMGKIHTLFQTSEINIPNFRSTNVVKSKSNFRSKQLQNHTPLGLAAHT